MALEEVEKMMNDKLEKFRIAEALNKEHSKTLKEKKLHFRGNLDSFSLISLSQKTAERGTSGLKSKPKGEIALEKIVKRLKEIEEKIDRGKSRLTPEKELQAWIIHYALNHKRVLPFGENIQFITSELAITKEKKRIVNDILGFDNEKNLVIIELKSDRLKAELERQIEKFEKVVKEDPIFFERLTYLIMEDKWSGGIKKMIVWPYAKTSPFKKWKHEISEVCYENSYNFQ